MWQCSISSELFPRFYSIEMGSREIERDRVESHLKPLLSLCLDVYSFSQPSWFPPQLDHWIDSDVYSSVLSLLIHLPRVVVRLQMSVNSPG